LGRGRLRIKGRERRLCVCVRGDVFARPHHRGSGAGGWRAVRAAAGPLVGVYGVLAGRGGCYRARGGVVVSSLRRGDAGSAPA
jgi:hypothetical protein